VGIHKLPLLTQKQHRLHIILPSTRYHPDTAIHGFRRVSLLGFCLLPDQFNIEPPPPYSPSASSLSAGFDARNRRSLPYPPPPSSPMRAESPIAGSGPPSPGFQVDTRKVQRAPRYGASWFRLSGLYRPYVHL
jgi:hypothetical protein